jgi:hypothetical protein
VAVTSPLGKANGAVSRCPKFAKFAAHRVQAQFPMGSKITAKRSDCSEPTRKRWQQL